VKEKRIRLTLNIKNKKLARQWHPTKNAPLTPKDVTYSSSKKVWWMCKNGHEWQTTVYYRHNGYGCPYCSGRKVCKDNCLQTVNPRLAKEWHPIKNAPLTPRDVTSRSRKEVWWICREKGHEWKTKISHRNNGSGCPYCSGQKVCKDNCLQMVNPKLAKEWHHVRNAPLSPKEITGGSNRKVWWICRKGHAWQATVATRKKGVGCPYCSGYKVSKDNCLQTVNPKLAKEWHPTKNAPLTPKDVTRGSNRKVWWICKKGHEWQAVINSRNMGRRCPYCTVKKATKENCLQTVSPRFAREWHPTKNAPLTPRDVTRGSNKKVWWVCRKGHEWQETVFYRFKGFGCPLCILGKKNIE
jgi:hypothetical protein